MHYYLELVPEYTIKKPEREEKKLYSNKKKAAIAEALDSGPISDGEDSKSEINAAKKKQDVERVAVNLAETQEAKFQKLQDAFGALEAGPAITENKTIVEVKAEVKE